MTINAPAVFEREAEIVWRQGQGGVHGTITFPVRPGGMWAANSVVDFDLKLGAPCRRWEVAGFPIVRMNVFTGPKENTDTIRFTSSTPPVAGRPVTFTVECERPVAITGQWSPV